MTCTMSYFLDCICYLYYTMMVHRRKTIPIVFRIAVIYSNEQIFQAQEKGFFNLNVFFLLRIISGSAFPMDVIAAGRKIG